MLTVPIDSDQARIALVNVSIAPLLQLDDDERRLAGAGVLAGQNGVYAAAAERQPVFQQYLDVTEPGLDKIVGEYRDTALPRTGLARRRPCAVPEPGLLEHQLSHTATVRQGGQAGG